MIFLLQFQVNIPECNYDSGECCGLVSDKFCEECKCLDPNDIFNERGIVYPSGPVYWPA